MIRSNPKVLSYGSLEGGLIRIITDDVFWVRCRSKIMKKLHKGDYFIFDIHSVKTYFLNKAILTIMITL